MELGEIYLTSEELNAYGTAGNLAAEIAILTEEIGREAKLAAKRFRRLDLEGYKKHRGEAAEMYKQLFVLQRKLREEIEKTEKEKQR